MNRGARAFSPQSRIENRIATWSSLLDVDQEGVKVIGGELRKTCDPDPARIHRDSPAHIDAGEMRGEEPCVSEARLE